MFSWEALASKLSRELLGTELPAARRPPRFASWATPALLRRRRCTRLAKSPTVPAIVSGYAGWRRGGRKQNLTGSASHWGYLLARRVAHQLDVPRLTSLLRTHGRAPSEPPTATSPACFCSIHTPPACSSARFLWDTLGSQDAHSTF